jgi:hypothetical protein
MTERIKCTANFYQDEFVYPGGDFNLMDSKIILVAQWIREQLGKSVTINNYATGGKYKESGLRDINTKTGAKKSAHKEGKAIDIKVSEMTAKEFWDWCMDRQMELYAMGVREIEHWEDTPTWTHLSTRGNHLAIKVIRP